MYAERPLIGRVVPVEARTPKHSGPHHFPGQISMIGVLVPNDPVKERKRLLGQARHCRDLANSYDDARLKQELSAMGKSYEAKASLVVDGGLVRRQMHDGSQASPQRMQRLSGSASRV